MKRYGQRVLCLLFALVLTVQLCPAPSHAATVYFTAANDRLRELNAASMPFVRGSTYYVSNTIFNDTTLGVYYSRNKTAQTASLYIGGDSLTIDLTDGSMTDSRGNSYSYPVVIRSDYIFFPLTMLTEYLGLSYSIISTNYAPIIRIKSGSGYLSDRIFLDAAETLLSTRYNQYLKSTAGPEVKPPNQGGEQSGKYRICPMIRVSDSASAMTLLDQLSGRKWYGLFLFAPENLQEQADLLRRMVSSGQRVGFFLEDADPRQLEEANHLLFALTGSKTRAVYLPQGTAQQENTLRQLGYIPLQEAGDYSGSDLGKSAVVNQLLRSHRSDDKTTLLYFGSSQHLAENSSYFFGRLLSNQYFFSPWRESL